MVQGDITKCRLIVCTQGGRVAPFSVTQYWRLNPHLASWNIEVATKRVSKICFCNINYKFSFAYGENLKSIPVFWCDMIGSNKLCCAVLSIWGVFVNP